MSRLIVLAVVLVGLLGLVQAKSDLSATVDLSGAYGKWKYWGRKFRTSFYNLAQLFHQSRDITLESKSLAMQTDDLMKKMAADPNSDLGYKVVDNVRLMMGAQLKATEASKGCVNAFNNHDEKMLGFLMPLRKKRDEMLERIKELRVDTKMPEEARQTTLNELQTRYITFKTTLGQAELAYSDFHKGADMMTTLSQTCTSQSVDVVDKATNLQADPNPTIPAMAAIVSVGMTAATACIKSVEQAMRYTDAFIKAVESDNNDAPKATTTDTLQAGNVCALKASRKAALASKLATKLEATEKPTPAQVSKAAKAAQAAAKAAQDCADVAGQAAVAVAADLEAIERKKNDMLAAGFASCDQATKDTLRKRNADLSALAAAVVSKQAPFKAKVKKLTEQTTSLLLNKKRVERKISALQKALISLVSYTAKVNQKMADNVARIQELQNRQAAQRTLISERIAKAGSKIANTNTNPLFLKKICGFYNAFEQ